MDAYDYYRLLGVELPDLRGSGLGKYTDAGKIVSGGRIDRQWGTIIPEEKKFLGKEYRFNHPWLFDSELFRQHFNLRGVEYGNWLNQQDRANFLYAAGVSFTQLAQILGITHFQIGLGGRLGIAFGARGTNPKASAHYERFPFIVINLTKNEGRKGPLSHEFGHALDNLVSVDSNSKSHFVSADVFLAKNDTFGELFKKAVTPILTDKFFKAISRSTYYSKPHEIWARIFEMYISLKMDRAGLENPFLSNHITEYAAIPVYPSVKSLLAAEQNLDLVLRLFFQTIKQDSV